MKKTLIITAFAAFIVFAASCGSGSTTSTEQTTSQDTGKNIYYTCTMHPEVHSDKPGKCPICGMELIKKEVQASDSTKLESKPDSIKAN